MTQTYPGKTGENLLTNCIYTEISTTHHESHELVQIIYITNEQNIPNPHLCKNSHSSCIELHPYLNEQWKGF